MIARLARQTVLACVVIAVLFAAWTRSLAGAAAVLGGGALIGISFWAIRGCAAKPGRKARLLR
jgi:hypothetical protein